MTDLPDLLGHVDPVIRRFARRVTILPSGCWQWSSVRKDGYGTFTAEGRCHVPHRWLQERLFGPLPEGWTMDHVCLNRGCVNVFDVEHVEPVTHAENIARALTHSSKVNAAKTHCPKSHEYTPENTRRKRKWIGGVLVDAGRGCIQCERDRKSGSRKTDRQFICPNCKRSVGALGPHRRACVT